MSVRNRRHRKECCWAMPKRGSRCICITKIVPFFIHTIGKLDVHNTTPFPTFHSIGSFVAIDGRKSGGRRALTGPACGAKARLMQNFLDCADRPLSRRIIVCPPTLHSSLLGPKILPLGQQTEVQAANANANARRRLP